jgi:hypothetical protein
MAQPIWITAAGSLGTIAEGVFYQVPLQAYEPDTEETVYFEIIAGQLPAGVQISTNGLLAGIPRAIANVQGVPKEVSRDVTSKFAVRAYTTITIAGKTVVNRLADRTFTLTVTGQDAPVFTTPAGNIASYYDGSVVAGLQIGYTDTDPDDIVFVRLISGSLPPGLTISRTGLISGFTDPYTAIGEPAGFSRTDQGYDQFPFDFTTLAGNATYEFMLEVTDGKTANVRTFNIAVYSRNSLTADNTTITADNTFITADGTPVRIPIITTPEGSIGVTRSDNFFAFQFIGMDLDGDQYRFVLNGDDSSGVPGLTLDPVTGWYYGYIPNLGLTETIYNFSIQVYKLDNPTYISNPYDYSLTVTGPINSEIQWVTPTNLGTIVNGSTSTLYVKAISVSGLELQYQLLSGSASSLPQGLQLLPSGDIAGRCSFDTFTLDTGTTTFDVSPQNGIDTPTTFDLRFYFTVQVTSINNIVNVTKQFYITVVRLYNEPYENLYIQAMPPADDRALINGLLQNASIFPQSLLYRPTDPNFGVSTRVIYNHAFGLTSSTLEEYYSSLYENHYWKNLTLGEIEVAQATNAAGEVIYEVVYSRVIDNLLNDAGQSVSKQVTLPYPINEADSTEVSVVYPNSLINMRDQVIDTVGQIGNILPTWMLSKQANGRVLGFTPSWVIAYAKPGKGAQLAYNITSAIGNTLNLIDFEVDRYELDRLLSKNWNPATDEWVPSPPSYTTFDVNLIIPSSWTNASNQTVQWINSSTSVVAWYSSEFSTPTTFDGNSMMFIDPVDMYTNTTEYDKYLVFPKRTILG